MKMYLLNRVRSSLMMKHLISCALMDEQKLNVQRIFFFFKKKKKKRKSGETKSLDKSKDVGETKICWNTDKFFSF